MILCCGEALIDMIPSATTDGGQGFVPHCGGAVFNTAIALGRLGVPAGFLSGVSTDRFGQQLETGLQASQVDTSCLIRSDRPTTLAFVHLVDGHASYSFFDENSAGRMIAAADLPQIPDKVEALYFGGISLACDPAADTYATLLDQQGADRLVMIDPNIRPSFIRDASAFRARLDRMIGQCDILKISDEDLDWLVPGNEALEEKMARIQSLGPSVVILTKGAQGAEALLADGSRHHRPAQKAQVVDTVGAGDTFNAGFMAQLSRDGLLSKAAVRGLTGDQIGSALEFAARVAAITVSRAGANPPWQEDL
ncbi:MAG: carbohydrate kinase [Pelagimonas sp.]|jgi:fructokinase|nr:carbohydrate kinase [Pelagimonas sp.]